MTFNEYIFEAGRYAQRWPNQRFGQACSNYLFNVRPDLADRVRNTEVDPFYVDAMLDRFYAWVGEHWDDDPEIDDPASWPSKSSQKRSNALGASA